MKHLLFCCVALAFLIVGISVQALAEAPWANIGANSARTYMSTWPGPGAEIELLAKRPIGQHDHSEYCTLPVPTVSEQGTVVAKTDMLFGYDASGAELFTCDLGPNASGGTECGAIANGRIYAGAINTLYAFDLNGNQAGEISIGDPRANYHLNPVGVGPLGDIIVSASPDYYPERGPYLLVSISPQGDVNWTLESDSFGPPTVCPDGRILVATYYDWVNKLACINAAGTTLWVYDYPFEGLPAVDANRGAVLLRDTYREQCMVNVVALHLDSGAVAWEFFMDEYGYHSPYQGYRGLDAPLALDSQRGQYYAVWERGDLSNPSSYLLTALSDSGELLWSKQWQSDRSKRYDVLREVTLDSAGLLYLFYSYTNYKQAAVQGAVCCVEVLSPDGEQLAYREFESPDTSAQDLWAGGQPVIGTDQHIYLFETDYEDATVCSLYIFGPAGSVLPGEGYRPTILSAGYGLSRVTAQAGGTLTISAKVSHPLGASNIETVEVWLYGAPTGLCLLPGMSEGEYSLSIEVPAGFVPAGQFLLELVARDKEGHTSDVWPYMTVAPE